MAPLYPEKGPKGNSTEEASRFTELELTGVILMTTTGQEDAHGPWEHGGTKHQWAHGSGAIAQAYGDWLESLASWQWFVTRTYSPEYLTKGFTQAGETTAGFMLRDMLKRSAAKSFVAVYERQSRGDFHVHALLAGCRGLDGSKEESRDKAKFGFAKWKIFRGSGAGAYLAKYLSKDMMSLYIGLEGPYRSLEGLRV